ncbi:MAG: sigma-54-dependent Fis family transcriptional regulator [Nitrospirae bacterium]|nr:sigma-54-dependent Fis family transcriptional regulator [Nitrospirota bacterium]
MGNSNSDRANNILIIDDESQIRMSFKMILEEAGFKARLASSGREGINILKKENISSVLLDLKMPEMDGLETLKEIKSMVPDIPVIMITAFGDVSDAVEAIKAGAYNFIIKPPDFDELIIFIKRAEQQHLLQNKLMLLNRIVERNFEDVLGRSPAIKKVIEDLQIISNTNISIIIIGETGTGKSFLARLIHKNSLRRDHPFIEMDIGSLTESLIESELFGHVKGSFTGAELNKKGYLESSNTGTLFIDELQNMSLNVQSKLLGVLENKNFTPVGSNNPIKLDIRFIAATNKNITEAVSAGNFRADLFYRLNEYIINIPPLRDRKEDLTFFIEKFIAEYSNELNKSIKDISQEAMDMLLHNPWKGNIRELKNTIRRIVLCVKSNTINSNDISNVDNVDNHRLPLNNMSLKDSVIQHEIQCITNALKVTNGNKTHAASKLKITYRGLIKKINRLGILDY